ncbi:MAG TPA: acyltransferase family protein [Candidatus Dormibacteraeota bacterium]|nr:acyltransferase family protein [Candidatus Dormibacteraeota bacterium]
MTTSDLSTSSRAATAVDIPASAHTGERARLFFVDHLRVFLIALVVLHHLTITFAITTPNGWYYEVPDHSVPGELVGLLIILVNQSFFMGAFFLVSGYFSPASYDRKGWGRFLLDRLVRLVIPMLFFYFILGPLAVILATPGIPFTWKMWTSTFNVGPLWFAELLFIFCLGYTALRLLVRRPARQGSTEPAPPPTTVSIVVFTLVMAVASFALRLKLSLGSTLPILDLPSPAYLPQYVMLFAAGIVAYRRGWFRSIPDRMGWIGFALCGIATLFVFLPALLLGIKDNDAFSGGLHWEAAAYALWDSTMSVGLFLGLLVVFRRWANHASAIWNELSRNAFGVYVFHPPLIISVALLLTPIPLYPLLKLVVALAISLPLCFAVAGLVRRIPVVDRVL